MGRGGVARGAAVVSGVVVAPDIKRKGKGLYKPKPVTVFKVTPVALNDLKGAT